MTIDRIGQPDPILPGKKSGRNNPVGASDRTDSISLSKEAREKAEIYQVIELIKSVPELDDTQIAEIRQKINDPAYLNERIIDATAGKILDSLFI